MNWQDIAAPLIKLGLTGLGTAFGGPLGGTIGGALGSAIAGALGTDATPEAVSAALADNPDVAIAKLKDLESKRQDELAEYQAQLADVQDARGTTVELVKQGSPIAWGAPAISVVVIGCFALTMFMVLRWGIPAGTDANVVIGLTETLKQLSVAVVFYWVGSSDGSKRMGEAVREIARNSSIPSAGQVAGAAIRAVAKKVSR